MAAKKDTSAPDSSRLVAQARELISEIKAEQDRLYALAAAIIERTKPVAAGNPAPDPGTWRLAEILEERLGDCAQMSRLEECIDAIGEVSHG